MTAGRDFNRSREVRKVRGRLERFHSPRLHMTVIVALTGAAGFLSSAWLLYFGMTAMWQRYPLAVAAAYVAFLFLLWCWLRLRKDEKDLDIEVELPDSRSRHADGLHETDADGIGLPEAPEFLDLAAVDEGLPLAIALVVAIVVLFGAFWAIGWIISVAPVLFAEILVDAALARGLYRRLPGFEEQYWVRTVLRRTGMQFLVAALVLGIAGGLLQSYAPGARSIGQVFSRS